MTATAQELLRDNDIVRRAFEAWSEGKRKGPLERLTITKAIWGAFVRSAAGQGCTLAGLDLAGAAIGTEAPAAAPALPRRVCGRMGCLILTLCPHCGHCPLHCECEAEPVQPAPLAARVQTPVPAHTSGNPLIAMIADGLRDIGFSPDKAISAQRCEEIAFEQAQSVVEMVLEDLEKQGKLGVARHIVEVRTPEREPVEVEGFAPAWFGRLVKLHACRVPALLVGPAGSGKTTAVEMLAKSVGQPFHRISIAAGTDEGQLQGWLHPSSEGMRFEYVPSVNSYAYEHGGVVLIDDIDLGDANALGILNACLDNGPWHIPLRHHNPVFERHPDYYICAATNTSGHGADRLYAGANQLDERTLSRLRAGQIKCDYDSVLETNLYGNHRTGAAESLVFGHRLRARLRAVPGQLRDVSTRDIATRYTMLDQFSVAEAWYGQFCDWSEDELRRVHVTVEHDTMTAEME